MFLKVFFSAMKKVFVSMDGNVNGKENKSRGEQQGNLGSCDLFGCQK
jgi:hypothetical protein